MTLATMSSDRPQDVLVSTGAALSLLVFLERRGHDRSEILRDVDVPEQAAEALSKLPPPRRAFVEAVTAAIEETLLLEGGSLESVAGRLGTSTRTLRRRSNETDMPFRTLHDAVRRRRALELEGNARQSEIAAELGFDSSSAYRRAFVRWTGGSTRAWIRFRSRSSPHGRD